MHQLQPVLGKIFLFRSDDCPVLDANPNLFVFRAKRRENVKPTFARSSHKSLKLLSQEARRNTRYFCFAQSEKKTVIVVRARTN